MKGVLEVHTAHMTSGIRRGDWLQPSDNSTQWKRVASVQTSHPGGPLVIFEDYTTRVLTAEGRQGYNPTWFEVLREPKD